MPNQMLYWVRWVLIQMQNKITRKIINNLSNNKQLMMDNLNPRIKGRKKNRRLKKKRRKENMKRKSKMMKKFQTQKQQLLQLQPRKIKINSKTHLMLGLIWRLKLRQRKRREVPKKKKSMERSDCFEHASYIPLVLVFL